MVTVTQESLDVRLRLRPVRTEARFPSVPAADGHYESFYLKASAPEGGRAVWIRHTIHKRPNEDLKGAVWMTYFDVDRPQPLAAKRQVEADLISTPRDAYLRVGDSEIAPGRMQGIVEGGGVEGSWSLRFKDHSGPFRHFASDWMYERELPRTKLLSPHPNATFDGILEIDGERVAIDAWPGMVGHNWGAEHAESWIWIHAATEDDGSHGYVDLAAGRVRLGPWVTPWMLNGQIVHDGEQLRVGGFKRVHRTRISAEPTRCRFTAQGDGGATVRGLVGAPAERFVGWVYADPVGEDHHALNASIADLDLTIERSGRPTRSIDVVAAATYELGTRRTDHGIPIQPFPDG
jgi:hypothetical protein